VQPGPCAPDGADKLDRAQQQQDAAGQEMRADRERTQQPFAIMQSLQGFVPAGGVAAPRRAAEKQQDVRSEQRPADP